MGWGLPGLWLRDEKGWEVGPSSLGRKMEMGTESGHRGHTGVFTSLGIVCAEALHEGELQATGGHGHAL